jgi:methyltransferase
VGVISVAALTIVLLAMLGELWLSRSNERRLRAQGAIEPPDPVYGTMRWAYPGVFVAMGIEGALAGPAPGLTTLAGAGVLALAKSLKYWAIATLGPRWTYRVLMLPGVPLVSDGPYRLMRHPNYVAVIGELAGMALLVEARVSGPAGMLIFAALLYRRIQAEERGLY